MVSKPSFCGIPFVLVNVSFFDFRVLVLNILSQYKNARVVCIWYFDEILFGDTVMVSLPKFTDHIQGMCLVYFQF